MRMEQSAPVATQFVKEYVDAHESSTIQVDDGHRLITVTMKGPATDAGIMTLFRRLRTMPEFADEYSVLFDASNVGKVHVTGAGIFNLTQASQGDENRMAIVTVDQVGFGMARMYEISANWKFDRIAVFTDMQPALQFLGISS
jgi:hypothetical protein